MKRAQQFWHANRNGGMFFMPLESDALNVPDSTTIAVSCGTFNGVGVAKLTAIAVNAIN